MKKILHQIPAAISLFVGLKQTKSLKQIVLNKYIL